MEPLPDLDRYEARDNGDGSFRIIAIAANYGPCITLVERISQVEARLFCTAYEMRKDLQADYDLLLRHVNVEGGEITDVEAFNRLASIRTTLARLRVHGDATPIKPNKRAKK